MLKAALQYKGTDTLPTACWCRPSQRLVLQQQQLLLLLPLPKTKAINSRTRLTCHRKRLARKPQPVGTRLEPRSLESSCTAGPSNQYSGVTATQVQDRGCGSIQRLL
jgi:hypothetical protein